MKRRPNIRAVCAAAALLVASSPLTIVESSAVYADEPVTASSALSEVGPELDALRSEIAELRQELRMFSRDLTNTVRLVSAQARAPRATPPAARARAQAQQPPAAPDKCEIGIGLSPTMGPKDAPVTIVEFSSMTCGWCKREWPKIERIVKEYPNEVQFVFKHFPRNETDYYLHGAMEIARRQKGHEGFWQMYDLLLKNPSVRELPQIRELAQQMELNMTDFDKLMADMPTLAKSFRPDREVGRRCGVRGTPSVFINGEKLQNRDYETYKKIIDGIVQSDNDAVEADAPKPAARANDLRKGDAVKPVAGQDARAKKASVPQMGAMPERKTPPAQEEQDEQ